MLAAAMSSNLSANPPALDKGKGKATTSTSELSERSPLLTSQSHVSHNEAQASALDRQRLYSKLTYVFLVSLFVSLVFVSVLAFIVYSYAARASEIYPKDLWDRGLCFGGLDRVDVLDIPGDGTIRLEVEGRVGLDAGALLGMNRDKEDAWWMAAWKALGRWGVYKLDRVSVELTAIHLSSKEE